MNLNNMNQIPSPTKISIIARLRAINPKNKTEINNSPSLQRSQYTLFVPKNSSPSDILYISERPLEIYKINEFMKLKEPNINLNFLNFDKVYPETYPLDLIYQQILQNPINDLFYRKNSCMLFFGPTLGGKSYLLRGSPFKNENEAGLLTRAIREIFQRIEFNNSFLVKISVYQIYLDKIYDLLSNNNNELNIETKYSDINNTYNINILGLSKREIKNSNEYDTTLREAINNRRNLSKIFGVNDFKKKSHFIMSLYLENKNEENKYITYSQFDFVELVSSNFGLLNENENLNDNMAINQNLFQNTKNTFNSLADNIIHLSQDSLSTNNTTLTIALKNTMKPGSNIIFVNCVIPWEFPLKDSYSSLKFTNLIFSQIYKSDNNSNLLNNINNSTNNLTYSLEFSDNNNTCSRLNQNVNQNLININDSGYEKMTEYLNSLTIDKIDIFFPEKDFSNINNNNNNNKNDRQEERERNYKNEINEKNNNLFTKYNKNVNKNKLKKQNNNQYNTFRKINNKNIINKSYDIPKNNINKKNNKKKKNILSKKINKSLDNQDLSPKEKKLKKLNQVLKELENKSNELNQKSLGTEYLYNNISNVNIGKNSNISNNIFNNTDSNDINLNQDDKNKILSSDLNNTNIQLDKMKDEYSELKSNNIILKEDLFKLEQANKNLEKELDEQRNRNIEIINQNEELSNRLLKLESLLDEASIRDEKYKINEINIEKLLNEKLYLNSKIADDEKEYKRMKEEKEKYEIEYKVLDAKYNELKNNYDIMYNDYNNIKIGHDEKFYLIENKIDNLLKEIEKLQKENNILRNENERQRIEINAISTQRDDFKEKYNEQKNRNDLLSNKIGEIENEFKYIKKEKMNEEYLKLKCEENKKNRNENKMRIVNELQNKIQKYRQQRLSKGLDDY